MSQDEISETVLAEGQQALQQADAHAFLVWPRIVRRVILQDRELTGLSWHFPHRKTYWIARDRLLQHVAPDELGLAHSQSVPDRVILIARPDRDDLTEPTLAALKTWLWRMLLHARVHLHFEDLVAQKQFNLAQVRERIDRIGQSEYDEIRAVLKRENFLFTQQTEIATYIEFVSLFSELRHFAPDWRHSYFPSIHDFEAIDRIVGQDIDLEELAHATRLPGAILAPHRQHDPHTTQPGDLSEVVSRCDSAPPETRRARRVVEGMQRRANRLAAEGNSVRAALLRIQAMRYADPLLERKLAAETDAEIARLTQRLQSALQFEDVDAVYWRDCLGLLVRKALDGFWNNDARLLFDLQKVCVDHERTVSVVDLVGWVFSLGRQPLKRALPNQREVLMSKHLRSATARIPRTSLTAAQREILSRLLHTAARSAEIQLRNRLRPLISEALTRVDLEPKNAPERVARKKLIEELNDVVVNRGFMTIGDLRDAISRNNLKLSDLRTARQIVRGDQLIRADRELCRLLDGVYNPSDFYMRWLQRLSSLAFGTRNGRFITKFIAIPFGTSVVILEGLDHLVHMAAGFFVDAGHPDVAAHGETEHLMETTTADPVPAASELPVATPVGGTVELPDPDGPAAIAADATAAIHDVAAEAHAHVRVFMTWESFIGLGLFIVALIHVPPFRKGVTEVLKLIWKALRAIFFDTPIWFLKLRAVQQIIRSQPVALFRRYLLLPTIVTAFSMAVTLPFYSSWNELWISTGVTLAILCVVLNTRFGRDLEEVSSEYVIKLFHRVGVRLFLALFELIMDTFKRVLEFIERLLYAVDEWLRYKSGESDLTLIVKALLGVIWGAVTFVVRFAVNLLIEPQVNPIKHFPVVTVSHKIMLTTIPHPLTSFLHLWGNFSLAFSGTIAGIVVFLLPGAAGFIVWELKENWRLFVANRSRRLAPVIVGSHGETMIRLMKPGLHSGTLPKLFAKLRRAERKGHLPRWKNAKAVYLEKVHHVEESIHHFFERDFCALLLESRGWGQLPITPGHVEAASNSLRVELLCPALPGEPLTITFEEQSGWLLASIRKAGWAMSLSRDQFVCLQLALAGTYKIGGVDLIREQIISQFSPRRLRFDISDHGLIVWPSVAYDIEIRYNLKERRLITPRPRRAAREYELPELDARALLFDLNPISWRRWVDAWEAERDGIPIPLLFAERVHLLPNEESSLI